MRAQRGIDERSEVSLYPCCNSKAFSHHELLVVRFCRSSPLFLRTNLGMRDKITKREGFIRRTYVRTYNPAQEEFKIDVRVSLIKYVSISPTYVRNEYHTFRDWNICLRMKVVYTRPKQVIINSSSIPTYLPPYLPPVTNFWTNLVPMSVSERSYVRGSQ